MQFIKEVDEHGFVTFRQIKFRIGDMVCYRSDGRDKRDLVVDPTVYVETENGNLFKTTVKTTRRQPIADDILSFCHNYEMLDKYVAPARTLDKKRQNIIDYISKLVKEYRFTYVEYHKKHSLSYRDNLVGVEIDYKSIAEYADFILKYYENQDGIKYRRVYTSDGSWYYVPLDENYESSKQRAIDFMKYILHAPLDENGILKKNYVTPYHNFDVKYWSRDLFLNEMKKHFDSWTKFEFDEIYKLCQGKKEE